MSAHTKPSGKRLLEPQAAQRHHASRGGRIIVNNVIGFYLRQLQHFLISTRKEVLISLR